MEQPVLKNFRKNEHPDAFYYSLLKVKYPEIWDIDKGVLLLSHGQAVVERYFSVTDDMMLLNLKKEMLMAPRLVHDTVRSQKIAVHDNVITDKINVKALHPSQSQIWLAHR